MNNIQAIQQQDLEFMSSLDNLKGCECVRLHDNTVVPVVGFHDVPVDLKVEPVGSCCMFEGFVVTFISRSPHPSDRRRT